MDGGGSVRNGEVGGYLAGLGGMSTAIAALRQSQGQNEKECVETREAHISIIRSERDEAKVQAEMGSERPEKDGAAGAGGWKPVLGLSGEPGEPVAAPVQWVAAPGTVFDQPEPRELMELTVIVPARNEQECLGACLQSLVSQSEEVFKLGRDWELIVVDDHSTDGTAEIARGFAGVTVMEAGKLEQGWTGKANAIWTAARRARGRWLLFTDADTIHEPGNLHRAMHEATRHKVGMLSYSPRQIVSGLAQRALMPLVFCELSLAYPPAKVSDPNQRIAAANGQFLLVEREAYRKLGGHPSVADKVLEDVELAFMAKRRKVGLRFRYADDAVATRMYRSTVAMMEGWTKNLALLFDNSLALALWRVLDIALLVVLPVLAVWLWNARFAAHSLQWLAAGWVLALLWVRNIFRFYARVAKSNFPFLDCALAPLGLPLFVVLLYRSWFQHRILKRVSWKGRSYAA
jgi:glycosyltransferase involved in cell wall biosynthesis